MSFRIEDIFFENIFVLKFEEHASSVDAVHQPIQFIVFYTWIFAERHTQCAEHGAIDKRHLHSYFINYNSNGYIILYAFNGK